MNVVVHLTLLGQTFCANTAQLARASRADVYSALRDAFGTLRQRLLEHDHAHVAALQSYA